MDAADLIFASLGKTGLGGESWQNAFNAFGQQQQLGMQRQLTQAAVDKAQAERQQQAQYQTDIQQWTQSGADPAGILKLAARYPGQAEQLSKLYELQDKQQVTSARNYYGQVYSAAQSKAPDLIQSQVQRHRDAMAAQGMDTSDDDHVLETFKADPAKGIASAKALSLAHLYATDPGGFAKQFGDGNVEGKVVGNAIGHYEGSKFVVDYQSEKPDYQRIVITNPDGSETTRFENIAGGGDPASSGAVGNRERLINSDAGGGYVPDSVRTLGQFVNYGRAMNKRGATSSSAGLYQINGTTMAEFAPKALGSGWKTAPFDANAQDKVGEAIFDWAKSQPNPAQALKGRWVSLTGDEASRLVQGDWNAAKGLIARKESGGGPGATAAPSSGNVVRSFQTKPAASKDDLPPEALTMMAAQYLAGDKSVMQNLGRGVQGSKNIVKLRGEIAKQAGARGIDGPGIAATMAQYAGDVAASRTAGTRMANIELAVSEAQKVLPLARRASAALPRNGFLPFSRAQQAIRSGTNDPKLRSFVAANTALVNVYSRAISPTGTPTVEDKKHAREMLDTAFDQQSYNAVLQTMEQEMDAARGAPEDVRAGLRRSITGQGGGVVLPKIGDVKKGYRYKGGNPASPASWVRAQ